MIAGFETAARVTKRIRERLAEGARFAWLFGDRLNGTLVLRYAIDAGASMEHYCGVVNGPVESLTDVVPGALWHEREAHEGFGVDFLNVTLPPILDPSHPERLRRNHAPEVSTVLYGPIRSGIGESACWVIETAGEDFLNVVPAMFFKRRALERRFTGASVEVLPLIAEHVSGATAISHSAALARACETALGLHIPASAEHVRRVLLEFERIHQHLDALAKLADDGSLSVGSAQVFIAKERVHRLLAAATGSRFSRGSVCIGGLQHDIVPTLWWACEHHLDELERETLDVLDEYFSTQSLLDRLVGTGRLSRDLLEGLAAVGPLARASGISCDARIDGTSLVYGQEPEALETTGDALSRAYVRRAEIQMSFRVIREALRPLQRAEYRVAASVQNGTGFAHIESPQGELLYFARFEDGVAHIALRSASYQNWPAFVPALPNNIFTDFSFVEHSFGLIQSEVDR